MPNASPTTEELMVTSKIGKVKLSELRIDRSYQRDPSQQLVDEIASNWDVVASELVLVSNRGERTPEEEGGLYLVNGQHRSLAARKLGIPTIDARIIDLTKVEDPGAIESGFRLKTNVKLSDRPLERFKAQLRAGDEDSQEIVRILERFGTFINDSPSSDEGINAVSTVEALFLVDPTGSLLAETLQVIADAFGKFGGRTVSAGMLKGIAWWVEQHGDTVDRSRLVERLRLSGTESIYRRALTLRSVMGGSEWKNYYRAFVDIYNEGLTEKSRLKLSERGANRFAARSRIGSIGRFGGGSPS